MKHEVNLKHPKRYSVPEMCQKFSLKSLSNISHILGIVFHLRGQSYLRESCSCHLHPAFIRGVDLQVVAVGAVQAQEPTAWKPSIVSWKNVHRVWNHGYTGYSN